MPKLMPKSIQGRMLLLSAVAILAVFAVVTTGALAALQRVLAPWAHRRPGG